MSQKKSIVRYVLAAVWLIFTLSLAAWWIVYGLEQIENIRALAHHDASLLARQQKMLLWEGSTLIVLLLGAGLALAYYMFREVRQRDAAMRFLATFTHELKTPIASLRLQAETLQEKVTEPEARSLLSRLVADTTRLTLQLDNSLFLADKSVVGKTPSFHREELSLRETIELLALQWPQISISLEGDAIIITDRRAFESILQNIIQNAIVHGNATTLTIRVVANNFQDLTIDFVDNGKGFTGDIHKLGRLFERFYKGSGSGIGLYLSKTLASQMNATMRFQNLTNGFLVSIRIPGKTTHELAATR